MTRPKFRPCTYCQSPNQANRKTCISCYKSLSTKKILKEKVQRFDKQWGQAVVKSRNACRIIDSARIAVRKLDALGYKPILFLGKKEKASDKWVADVITHFEPTATTRNVLEKMQRAYEFILSKGTSVPEQSHTSTEQQFVPPKEQCADKQTENLIYKEEQTEKLPDEHYAVKQTQTITEEQPVMLTNKLSITTSDSNIQDPLMILDNAINQQEINDELQCLDDLIADLKQGEDQVPVKKPEPTVRCRKRDKDGNEIYARPGATRNQSHKKSCQKCSGQKVFLFESVSGRRTNAGKEEIKIHWLPCSACGKIWDDTWESASKFSYFAVPGAPPPSASEQVLP